MKKVTAANIKFQKKEIISLLISSVVIAFVLSWRDWGDQTVDVSVGLTSLIVSFIVAIAIILLRVAVQKILALREGYFLTYKIHKWGLAGSIFLAFFLNGAVPYVTSGELTIKESHRLRLGSFRYGLNYKDLAKIAIAGAAVCVLLMIIVKPIYLLTQNLLIYKIIQVSGAIAFFSLIPIPGSGGFDIFYYRRWLWVLVTAFVGTYFALILYAGLFSYIITTFIAVFATIVYVKQID